ncbi:MAG: response regulator [Rubrivivax sp.]|nr:response regulator [Rubrivivax sp.]
MKPAPLAPDSPGGAPIGGATAEMQRLGLRALTQAMLVLGAVVGLVSLIEMQWGGSYTQVGRDRLGLAAVLLAAAAPALALRDRWPRLMLAWLLAALVLALTWLAWQSRLGVHMMALAAGTLAVAVAGPTLGLRAAAGLAALHLACVGALAWAEARGFIDGLSAAASLALPSRVVGHGLVAAGGLVAAALLARMVRAAFARAEAERARVTELMRLGSDWTWELDAKARMVAAAPSTEWRVGEGLPAFLKLDEAGQPRIVDDADWQGMQQLFRNRRPFRDHPISALAPDGSIVHAVCSGTPVFDANGRVLGWRGVGRDVTAEHRARLAQQRSEALLNRLFESSPDALCVGRSSDGRILLANAGFLALTGLTQAEALAKTVGELALWPNLEEPRRIFRAMRAGDGAVRDLRTSVRLPDGRPREVLVTAAGFETDGHMMAVVTLRDITEVERAKHEAEAANRAKSAFLATMSHEIRTPLNGVLGLARLLGEPGLDEGLRAEYLAHLAHSAQLLSGLVSDVLDLSKIESGHLQVERIDFDLHEVLQGAFAAFAALGQERGLAMSCQLDAGLPRRVRGDPVRVRQIVANYLSNAVKFTRRGTVTLQAQPLQGGRVRLSVRDSGPGVAPGLQPHLFEPFVQADGSTTRRFGGTGLGLSICRQLAKLMGGEVGVESDGASGSLFWAELPLPAQAGAAPHGDARARPAPGDAQGAPLVGMTVLVAEDNAVNLLIVVAMLQRLGALVVEATDGETALQAARQHAGRLNAVLMDLHMPGRDGLQVTQALRADPATAALPIFAFSAAVLDHERRAAEAAGMNGFIAKPAELADLVRALRPLAQRLADPPVAAG